MKKQLITIVGATGIGKTSLSIKVASYFKAPIISCDSRQFYKEMTIGTAVPTPDELSQVPHFFIQNRSIMEDYSVGDFERDALKKLDELYKEHDIVVMVGGSGLYVNAVLNGLDYFPDVDKEIRFDLNQQLKDEGLKSLQNQLKKLDPESFQTIEIDNPHRLVRALEICIGTGKSYSSFKTKSKKVRNFGTVKIGITAPREIIYTRINERVDIMLKNGLLKEVKGLYKYRSLNALQTVGYKELFSYLDGVIDFKFAIEEIKKNTRRFAKRQVTWNKKDSEIHWYDYALNPTEICEHIDILIKNR